MKTILDDHPELSLDRVIEDDTLRCYVRPMKRGPGSVVTPDEEHAGYELTFPVAFGYFVFPEVVQSGLGLEYVDGNHLSEVRTSKVKSFFGIDQLFPSVEPMHISLRTAHFHVNVFCESAPDIRILT